ncbi:radical SAM protein [bacterium]|nr:radical SAM protein [bacterium]
MPDSFQICEIYETLMGESGASGWPCTIIRMGGCNLKCSYCDTKYAQMDFQNMSLEEILKMTGNPYPRHVLVTGGEPLVQPKTPFLINALLERGHKIYLETNGSMDISQIDTRVVRIMDIKCPASGQSHMNRYQNLIHLTKQDEIKFVIGDRNDFIWAKGIIERHGIQNLAQCIFSPVEPFMKPSLLADWILEDRLEVRLQLQIHKILWGSGRGR